MQEFNENMDMIDAQMAQTEEEVAGVSEKIGADGDTGTETIFGRLAQIGNAVQGISIIKSIQPYRFEMKSISDSKTQAVQPVNKDRCIVLYQLLGDEYNGGATMVDYTFSGTELSITTHSTSGSERYVLMEFWIIEFY